MEKLLKTSLKFLSQRDQYISWLFLLHSAATQFLVLGFQLNVIKIA